ncbi:hypothetical protein PFISCL1PPCAC_23786 [Pristionchus fissidentatus]|uniref:Toca-1 n=1 Tax=Pristionchus fissidentatus TaxID=1538716 RepID=A0AAV5WP55_9BILA|nr:hypothetical protein PFISCL1PPCAC_23786 [Pristionchus fissidentatus]
MVLSYEARGAALRASVMDLIHATGGGGRMMSGWDEDTRLYASAWKDQTDVVASHTNKGIEFLEKVGGLCKERAAIEEEYAKQLRSLVKKNLGKKKEDDEAAKTFTYVHAFNAILREVDALAGQHEVLAERMKKELLPFVAAKGNAHRAARKQGLGELGQINTHLQQARDNMSKQQKAYGKAFKEAEAAFLKYNKAEKNMDISRLDLERAKNTASQRSDQSEEAKQTYAHALTAANQIQQNHFQTALPSILDRLRSIDDERIRDTKAALEMAINTEKEVSVIITRCHDDMRRALEVIDPPKDTAALVEQFRPEDVLNGGSESIDGNGGGTTLKRGMLGGGGSNGKKDSKGVTRKQSMHSKIFGGSSGGSTNDVRKNPDGTSDYSSLPPQQRVRRLQAKLGEMEKEREKKVQSREGVAKMQQVYRDNPKLGNPADCEQQIVSYGREIEALTQTMNKLRLQLDDAIAHTAPPMGGSDTPPSSRSESGASSHYSGASSTATPAPPRPLPPSLNGTMNGGGTPTSHTSHRTSYSEESVSSEGSRATNNNGRDEVYDEMPAMVVLGTCTALFDFEGGTTEGTVIMKEGQEFMLVERDEGDGWTRVRSQDGKQEGFVPSSYLRCKWYPSD